MAHSVFQCCMMKGSDSGVLTLVHLRYSVVVLCTDAGSKLPGKACCTKVSCIFSFDPTSFFSKRVWLLEVVVLQYAVL